MSMSWSQIEGVYGSGVQRNGTSINLENRRLLKVVTDEAPASNNFTNLKNTICLKSIHTNPGPLPSLKNFPPVVGIPRALRERRIRCRPRLWVCGRGEALSNVDLLEEFARNGEVIGQWCAIRPKHVPNPLAHGASSLFRCLKGIPSLLRGRRICILGSFLRLVE